MHYRVFLSRWRGDWPCPECDGARLRPEALAVKVEGLDISEVSRSTIQEALAHVQGMSRDGDGPGRQLIEPLRSRLAYLDRIGLGYLTLDRRARSLSGGEARRVALTRALGSGLVNTLYVLDEPSIGLHPRDVHCLVESMSRLRDSGNTVVVVEHETSVMRSADLLVDVGPGAGEAGGRIVYRGAPDGVVDCVESLTGDFLSGRRTSPIPTTRRPTDKGAIVLRGARGHNLKKIDVTFPLGVLCVITGVSGSGKSSLIEETLFPALLRQVKGESLPSLPFDELCGAGSLSDVALIDQGPIGRTPRSNPVTYLKAFDEIRKIFAATHDAKARGYVPGTFSFNVAGGRCEACEGHGYRLVDMQFLPDVMVRCPECRGTRYRPEVLEVTYRGRSIAETLDLTVREAFGHFRNRPRVQAKLRPLLDVGLDYLRLGQPANTLSGGEAQRLKLAAILGGPSAALNRSADGPKSVFVIDEPTTGLHPADVTVLLQAFDRLADLGHSLIVVEHSPDVMAAADWVIDLGPEAGEAGGQVVAEGPPERVAQTMTHTGRVLADVFAASRSTGAARDGPDRG